MTLVAPTLQSFFTVRPASKRNASPNTVASYRDAFRLLLNFVHEATGVAPAKLTLEELDATMVSGFLDHLESSRSVSRKTRNSRLAAVHSLYRFAAMQHPEHAALIQRVLAIPAKRTERPLIAYLTTQEINALLAAPDVGTRLGRRDRALLAVAVRTGLRASELAFAAATSCSGPAPKWRVWGRAAKLGPRRSLPDRPRPCERGWTRWAATLMARCFPGPRAGR